VGKGVEAAELVGAEALGAAGVGCGGVFNNASEGVPAIKINQSINQSINPFIQLWRGLCEQFIS
jgi:hypothetical protein